MNEKKNRQNDILSDGDLKEVNGGVPPRPQPSFDGKGSPTVVKNAAACSKFCATDYFRKDQSCKNCMFNSVVNDVNTCNNKLISTEYSGYL